MILIQNDSAPLNEKHIAWFVTETEKTLLLNEVVVKTYVHPDSEGMMHITDVEISTTSKEVNKRKKEAAPLWLLKYAQDNIEGWKG